jgi:hypothetical protein
MRGGKTMEMKDKLRVPLINKEPAESQTEEGSGQQIIGKVIIENERRVRWVRMESHSGVYSVGLTQLTVALVVLI